eukprot:scaffold10796_cov114-Isochrysis_galbana.AAC.10
MRPAVSRKHLRLSIGAGVASTLRRSTDARLGLMPPAVSPKHLRLASTQGAMGSADKPNRRFVSKAVN